MFSGSKSKKSSAAPNIGCVPTPRANAGQSARPCGAPGRNDGVGSSQHLQVPSRAHDISNAKARFPGMSSMLIRGIPIFMTNVS